MQRPMSYKDRIKAKKAGCKLGSPMQKPISILRSVRINTNIDRKKKQYRKIRQAMRYMCSNTTIANIISWKKTKRNRVYKNIRKYWRWCPSGCGKRVRCVHTNPVVYQCEICGQEFEKEILDRQ